MIVELLGGIRATIFAALAALLLILAGVQHAEVSHYRVRAVALQSAVETFQSAQATNLATIKTLQAANTDWASKCKANQPEAAKQTQLSAKGDTKRQAGAAKSIKSLQATYEREPTVKAWADTHVPAAAVDSLRHAGNPD